VGAHEGEEGAVEIEEGFGLDAGEGVGAEEGDDDGGVGDCCGEGGQVGEVSLGCLGVLVYSLKRSRGGGEVGGMGQVRETGSSASSLKRVKRYKLTSRRGLLARSSGILAGFLAKAMVSCSRNRSSRSRHIPAGPVPPKTRIFPFAMTSSEHSGRILDGRGWS